MHSFRNLALAFVFGIAAASAAWMLWTDSGTNSPDARQEGAASPSPAQPTKEDPRTVSPERPGPTPPAKVPQPAPAGAAPRKAIPAPHPIPAADPADDLFPEHLDIAEASWNDVLVTEILRDVASRGNFVIRMPRSIEKILDGKRVTLDVTKTTGAMVIARVLQPYNLTYTTREGVVRIIPDPGD